MKNYIRKRICKGESNVKKVEEPFFTRDIFADKPYKIGEYTYGKPLVLEWGEGANLIIGKFCSIADEVKIFLGGNHRIDWISTYPFNVLNIFSTDAKRIIGHPSTKGNVVIGNDVWIGFGATILSGITIGDGAVIGANAVVSKNVDAYTIVVGNPARVTKKRFDDEIIDKLVKIAWWNWPIDRINSEVHFLCNNELSEFILRNLK